MRNPRLVLVIVCIIGCEWSLSAQPSYPGFDRNMYPGDASLPALRQSFRFTGYWLNTPPGARQNTWLGKRGILKQNGFGFLVLFNGRLDAELRRKDAAALGAVDGEAAAKAAVREGFPPNVLIFLDLEEGGRLLPEQSTYIFAWAAAVRAAGARAGIYCSGIDVPDGKSTISTVRDLVAQEEARAKTAAAAELPLVLWVANDQCPPAPGCTLTNKPASVGFSSPPASATVWQYAQSPRRKQFTASCAKTYDANANCYAPGLPQSPSTFLDLNVASSPDPSEMP